MKQSLNSRWFRAHSARFGRRRVGCAVFAVILASSVTPALAQFQETWDDPASINCWFYFGSSVTGPVPSDVFSLTWAPNGHGGSAGFVACDLARLTTYPPTGPDYFWPIFTFQDPGCPARPDLRSQLLLRVFFNRRPAVPGQGSTGPAMFPGRLHFWVGHGDPLVQPMAPYAFYMFKPSLLVPWCTEWTPSSIRLSTTDADWELLASGGQHQSLDSLLAGPEQMGLLIAKPGKWKKGKLPTGWLGLDSLSFEPAPPVPPQTTWVVDGRLQGPGGGADFRTLNEAVCDWRVGRGHTLQVVGGQEYSEIVFDTKALRIYGQPLDGVPPTLTTPADLVNPGAQNHFWLEAGGELHTFILKGPGSDQPYKFSGFTFTNPSLLNRCELTDYPTAACVAFCAANAIDYPSGVRYNLIARSQIGIANGDVEHIHLGNVIIDNTIGLDLIAGNSAQVLNNLIVSNWTGVRLTAYAPEWTTYSEIANNTICGNAYGVTLTWTPHPDANYPARSLLAYTDPYRQATEADARAEWTQYLQTTPPTEPASPISAVIRDNIFAYNSAPAIQANTHYGAIRPGEGGQVDPTQGGCYAQIRNNLFYRNHLNYEGEDPDDPYRTSKNFEYDLPYPPPDEAKPRFRVPNPPGAPGYISGRMVQNLFADPKWANDPPWSGNHPWIVQEDSPCINAGSTTLRLGYIYVNSENGNPVWDTGALDVGYHLQPMITGASPLSLRIARRPNGEVNVALEGTHAQEVMVLHAAPDVESLRPARRVPFGSIIDADGVTFTPRGPQQFLRGEF